MAKVCMVRRQDKLQPAHSPLGGPRLSRVDEGHGLTEVSGLTYTGDTHHTSMSEVPFGEMTRIRLKHAFSPGRTTLGTGTGRGRKGALRVAGPEPQLTERRQDVRKHASLCPVLDPRCPEVSPAPIFQQDDKLERSVLKEGPLACLATWHRCELSQEGPRGRGEHGHL